MMEAWILMFHRSLDDYMQARGDLMGGLYSDIESAARAIADDWGNQIVSVEYHNGGDNALLRDTDGRYFGVYKSRMPMREDMPTKQTVRTRNSA